VVFGHVDHAKQALGRLQNFPIWGRPLRLAFSRAAGDEAKVHIIFGVICRLYHACKEIKC
jgi:hypothetical protein